MANISSVCRRLYPRRRRRYRWRALATHSTGCSTLYLWNLSTTIPVRPHRRQGPDLPKEARKGRRPLCTREGSPRLPVRRPTPHSKALDCKGQCHRRRYQATTEKKQRVATKKFRSVVGKLRQAAVVLPAAKSLFTQSTEPSGANQPSSPLEPRANFDMQSLTCVP
jgi:hypothetical protein